jgi:TonB family protein
MPTSSSRPPACSSVELEFVVDEDGTVEGKTVHIVRTNNVEYGDAILAAVPSWRYQPATRDGKPVRQIVNEKVALVTQVVVVPKGSTPTRGTTAPPRVPTTC